MEKQAFWMRYTIDGITYHAAVIADTLDDAFDILIKSKNVDPDNITYRNRIITVIDY